ncbi:MAG: aspartate-semialdehyde dehydrogenase [Candidatus Omnitrophota bacterium]|nr:aspartate-semialdehyde dehydrogenase [Candidatus Omnitrophota bacterium]
MGDKKKVNVAVIGVGVVGVEILRVLKQRKFPVNNLKVFARSARQIDVDSTKYDVEAIADENFDGINIALFAGTEGEKGASRLYAQKFIEKGAVVIDNGADFRLEDGVPLVVPEVNKDKIKDNKGLIANPNCTTIQAIVALGPIHKNFGLDKVILTSFQATSGAGLKASASLWDETKEIVEKNKGKDFSSVDKTISSKPACFSDQIAFNVIPQIGGFGEHNYTSEEWKVVNETHKILGDDSIKISATCVRVPVVTSHSEAIYFTTKKETTVEELEKVLGNSPGIKYLSNSLPSCLSAEGGDDVFVSRLRRDPFCDKSFWLWCVSDNLRKGAALNAVQIAECLSNNQN